MWRKMFVLVLNKGTDKVVLSGNLSEDEKKSLEDPHSNSTGMIEEKNAEILRKMTGPLALDGKMPADPGRQARPAVAGRKPPARPKLCEGGFALFREYWKTQNPSDGHWRDFGFGGSAYIRVPLLAGSA